MNDNDLRFRCTLSTGAPLTIPQDWSPEEALAIWTFFDTTAQRIWDNYHRTITELLPQQTEEQNRQPDLFDDDIPF